MPVFKRGEILIMQRLGLAMCRPPSQGACQKHVVCIKLFYLNYKDAQVFYVSEKKKLGNDIDGTSSAALCLAGHLVSAAPTNGS